MTFNCGRACFKAMVISIDEVNTLLSNDLPDVYGTTDPLYDRCSTHCQGVDSDDTPGVLPFFRWMVLFVIPYIKQHSIITSVCTINADTYIPAYRTGL